MSGGNNKGMMNTFRKIFAENAALSPQSRNTMFAFFRKKYRNGNVAELTPKERAALIGHLSNANRFSNLKKLFESTALTTKVIETPAYAINKKWYKLYKPATQLTNQEQAKLREKFLKAKQIQAWGKGKKNAAFNAGLEKRYGKNVNKITEANRAERKVFKVLANEIVKKINESMRYLRTNNYKESFKSISTAKDMLDKAKKDFNKEISPYLKTIYALTSVNAIKTAINTSNANGRARRMTPFKNNTRVYKGVLGGNTANSLRSKIRRSMFGGAYTLAVIPKVRKMDIEILTYKNYAERLKAIAARLNVKKPANVPKPPMAPMAPAAPKGPGFVNQVRNKYKRYQNARAAKKAQNANAALLQKIKNKMGKVKGNIGNKANNTVNVNYNNNNTSKPTNAPKPNSNRSPEITPAA